MKTVLSSQNNIMKNKIFEQSSCPAGYSEISASDVPNHDPKDVKVVGDFYCLKNKNTSNPNPTPQPAKFTEVNIKPEEVYNGTKVVYEGMKGDIVWKIQNQLSKIGLFKKNLTNNFGAETKKAVVNFQTANKDKLGDGRVVDGKVGQKTWCLLFQGTEHACKNVDTKPTEVKQTEVKPTEVVPTKPKKTLKPLDVINPEKYSGGIVEQANDYTDISTGISNLKGLGRAANRPTTNQAAPTQPAATPATPAQPEQKVEDPVQILKRVINTDCINSLKKEIGFEFYGRAESQPRKLKDNTYAIVGVNNDTEEFIYLYSNGTGKRVKVDENNQPIQGQTEDIEWECSGFKESTSRTADNNQMTADQQKFVKDIVARGNGYYKTEMPSGYDEGQGAWKRTDLSTVQGGERLFKPNTFFVWAKTGVVGKKRDYVAEIEEIINQAGYTFDAPPTRSAAAQQQETTIGKAFPESNYGKFIDSNTPIWFTGETYSNKVQGKVGSIVEKIKADKSGELEKEFCRGGVDALYDAAFNPTKVYFKDDADLRIVKDYVKRCERELRPNAMSNLLGGSRKKFQYLKANRSGTDGALRFMLGEQKNNLNSLIKKKLVEAKAKKENDTIGKQLIENRLKMIVESIKKQGNIVEKKNLEKVSLEFINELKELNNQGLINENLSDSLKNIFGTGLETMPQKFFEVIFDRILTKLGLNDVALKNALVDSSKNNPTEIVNSFKDCESMTELIAKTITDILYMNLQSEKNLKGQGWNLIRNILGQEIKKEEFLKNIKTNLNSAVCQEFSNLTSNSQNLLSKIKGATI
jgi:hypothetical protein